MRHGSHTHRSPRPAGGGEIGDKLHHLTFVISVCYEQVLELVMGNGGGGGGGGGGG